MKDIEIVNVAADLEYSYPMYKYKDVMDVLRSQTGETRNYAFIYIYICKMCI